MDVPFHNLPNEILVEIFKHLDVKSLKEAALVCKRWSDVIGGSPKIMRKFMLYITSFKNRDLSEVLDLKRKFVNVKVSLSRFNCHPTTIPEYYQLLLQVLEHAGVSCTHFSLELARLTRHELTSVLRSMPELNTIVFEEVDIRSRIEIAGNVQHDQESPIVMKKLKELRASYTTWSLLDIILAPNLTYLNINGLNQDFYPISFIRFIETAANLQQLIIRSHYERRRACGNAPSSFCKNFPVFYETLGSINSMLLPKLDTLEIGVFTIVSWDPFCKFISKRSNTLKKLTLDWGYTNNQPKEAFAEIFQVAFGKLQLLNELTIGSVLKNCPNDAGVFDSLEPNKSIESLKLGIYDLSKNVFEGVLCKCTRLESLEICELTDEKARFIANNLKLAKLTVEKISCQNVHFSTLKTLQVLDLINSHWQNFLKINSSIQTLIVSERVESQSPTNILDYVIDETNVKHLTLKTYGPISSDVYSKVKENPKRLETLEWICTKILGCKPNRVFIKFPIESDLNWLSSNESKKQQTSIEEINDRKRKLV